MFSSWSNAADVEPHQTNWQSVARYDGAVYRTASARRGWQLAILKSTRFRTGSQCNFCSTGKMWLHHRAPDTRRARRSSVLSRLQPGHQSVRYAVEQWVAVVQATISEIHDTSLAISSQPPTSLLGFICMRSDTSSSYLAVDSTHTAAGAFSTAGPTVWNSLPNKLRDQACGPDSFNKKAVLSQRWPRNAPYIWVL